MGMNKSTQHTNILYMNNHHRYVSPTLLNIEMELTEKQEDIKYVMRT